MLQQCWKVLFETFCGWLAKIGILQTVQWLYVVFGEFGVRLTQVYVALYSMMLFGVVSILQVTLIVMSYWPPYDVTWCRLRQLCAPAELWNPLLAVIWHFMCIFTCYQMGWRRSGRNSAVCKDLHRKSSWQLEDSEHWSKLHQRFAY